MFENSLLFNSAEGAKAAPTPNQSMLAKLKPLLLPCLILSGIASVALGLLIYRWPADTLVADDSTELILSLDDKAADQPIYVYISGAVERPGVYSVREGDRVDTVIKAAGGISANADKYFLNSQLNLSLRLKDEQKIHIPFEGEGMRTVASNSDSLATPSITPVSENTESLVSINTATESELDALPGVGPATITKIVAGRPYTSIAELLEKKVVNQSVYAEIQSLIHL